MQDATNEIAIEIRETCLGDALDEAAARWGERTGWVFGDVRVSFREMRERSDAVAASLIALGIEPGDVVALWTPNLAEYAYCEFACAKAGAIITALNTRFRSFELRHVLAHSEAKILIMVDRFQKQDFAAMLRELCPDWVPSRDGELRSTHLPSLRRVVSLSRPAGIGALPWDDFLAHGRAIDSRARAARQARQNWRDPVILQYTSGTTALPKGALCNHRYVLNFGNEYTLRTGIRPGEPVLNTQPFYHVGGSCGALPLPLTHGFKVVTPEHYEPETVLGLIERERCVSRTGYGAMYVMEMNHPRFRDFDLGSLRCGWTVGTPALLAQIRDTMNIPNLTQIYGTTEGGGTGGHFAEPWEVRATTCGRPVSGMAFAIIDPATGRHQPAGATGEICLRGWWQMNGYHKQPDATAKAIDGDGWLHTGDLGFLDSDGYLHFVSRLKDMLKVGGENVAAEEVEAVLLLHPDVKQAAVIGAPDPRLTEVVMAIVELRGNAAISEQEVMSFCLARMAGFRAPRYVRFTREWPMTGSGKIQKHVLRDRFLAEFRGAEFRGADLPGPEHPREGVT